MLSIIAGLFVLWFAFVLFATSARGPGLSPDSMSYLAAAESIARGAGPEVPVAEWSQPESHSRLRHFPPLFPALIAVPVALGLPAAQAARWLEALAAGTLAALLAWIAVSCLGAGSARARTGALVIGLGVMLAPAISLSFVMVLSEPVFLTLWAATLLLMVRDAHAASAASAVSVASVASAKRASFVLGCCAACCALTRYAGASVVAAVALWELLQRGSVRARGTRALIAVAPALVSLTLWRAWSGGEFRRYAWYVDGAAIAANAREAFDTLRDALAPFPESAALLPWQQLASAAAVGLTLLLLLAAMRRAIFAQDAPRVSALWRAVALMTSSYLGLLIVSRLRADPEIPFDWRILSPVVLSWQLVLSVALVRHWDRLPTRAARSCGAALGMLWLGVAGWNAAHNVLVMQREGALYDAPHWQDSQFARWLRGSGRSFALYSNNPAALWHLDHRSSWLLPKAAPGTASARQALRERLGEHPSRTRLLRRLRQYDRPAAVSGRARPVEARVLRASLRLDGGQVDDQPGARAEFQRQALSLRAAVRGGAHPPFCDSDLQCVSKATRVGAFSM